MYTKPPNDPVEHLSWFLEHMRSTLKRDMRAQHVWTVDFRTKSVDTMRSLARALRRARYLTTEQESVLETTVVGRRSRTVVGPPLVTAFWRAKPNASSIARRFASLRALAAKHKAKHGHVSSMDLEEFEMLYGPPKAMSLADSCWRLRHYSDTGLKAGAAMEYTFCLVPKDAKACRTALKRAGLSKIERAPKDADWTLSVTVQGVNSEKRLKAEFEAMKKTARAAGARLKGLML